MKRSVNLKKAQKFALNSNLSEGNKDFESTIRDANSASLISYTDGTYQLDFKASFIGLAFGLSESDIPELN